MQRVTELQNVVKENLLSGVLRHGVLANIINRDAQHLPEK
jgi:hypothetical protein